MAQVSCKYIFSLIKYLRKFFNNLQLFSYHFNIFQCVKINLSLKIKLGTFFGEKGHYSEHKNITKSSFAICCTSDTILSGLLRYALNDSTHDRGIS